MYIFLRHPVYNCDIIIKVNLGNGRKINVHKTRFCRVLRRNFVTVNENGHRTVFQRPVQWFAALRRVVVRPVQISGISGFVFLGDAGQSRLLSIYLRRARAHAATKGSFPGRCFDKTAAGLRSRLFIFPAWRRSLCLSDFASTLPHRRES